MPFVALRHILLFSFLYITPAAFCQQNIFTKQVRLSHTTGSVISLLQHASEENSIVIEFSPSFIQNKQGIALPKQVMTLGELLDALLAGQKVIAKVKNNKIILAPATVPMQKGSLLEHYYVGGYVQEETSLEPLPFAIIKAFPSGMVCQANVQGYYTMSLPKGQQKLVVLYAGYTPRATEINITGSMQLNLAIHADSLPAVKLATANTLLKDGGTETSKYLTNGYTNLLGEPDPVRSVYLLPGNVETEEITGKTVVRGGDPNHNLFLLDGSRVYNPTHLMGEISIVNETSLQSIRQYKSDFPGRFSDALSGITEVTTKDGNMAKWQGSVAASLLAGMFTIEGPLVKNSTAIMASLRQSWKTPVIRVLDDSFHAAFYDFHLKITQLINSRHKIMLSSYIGNDKLKLERYGFLKGQRWGNALVNVNWNYVLGNRSFLNTSVGISRYKTSAEMLTSPGTDTITDVDLSIPFKNNATITETEAKTQLDIISLQNVRFKFGARVASTTIHPLKTAAADAVTQSRFLPDVPSMSFRELGFFCEQEIKPTASFFIRPAIYFNNYYYKNYQHTSLQPRLFVSYRFLQSNQLLFSYAQMNQFLHQVSNLRLGAISDFWMPSTSKLSPAQSNMINIGYRKKMNHTINLSVDAYYKVMNHITNYAEGRDEFYDEQAWEDGISAGKGWSYGTEILLLKKAKKWSGQLSYTLSWSSRRFADINEGVTYPYKYDRRHILNIAFNYQLKKWWEINFVGSFHTGDWIALVPSTTYGPGDTSSILSTRSYDSTLLNYNRLNGQRTPSAYRFNLNTTIQLKAIPAFSHKLSAGISAVYAATNLSFFSVPWAVPTNITTGKMSVNKILTMFGYVSYVISF